MKKVCALLASLPLVMALGSCTPGGHDTPPWIVGSWIPDAFYYYLPGDDVLVLNQDGTAQMLDNYNGSGTPVDNGTWSLSDNVLTLYNFQGQSQMTITTTKISDAEWSFDQDPTRTLYFYRKGTQPGTSVFTYAAPSTTLSQGVPLDGVIPDPPWTAPYNLKVHQAKLYSFTAPSAGTYTATLVDTRINSTYTATAELSVCKADQVTTLFEGSAPSTPVTMSLAGGETVYLIVNGPYEGTGLTFNIEMQ